MDILDVWFESGSSWHAVLDAEPGENFPADLYTEGGDQHRGWFHSSLLTSVALRGVAPYRIVATSGWTLDEQGRAFSKSLGNGVDPVDVAKRLGAEIIRLWVASVDFREDVAASENLMQRVSDNYRKLRNTLRFLLGNLHDFSPATDAVAFDAMEPLDKYILARTAELDAKIRRAYDDFEFHRAYHALNEFVNTDLSALYLDVLKDRLYTFAPKHPARRSGQTALWRIAEALTRLIAPILSFTAEEVWAMLPEVEGREPSVHLALFPDLADIVPGNEADLEAEWVSLLALRTDVLARLELLRADKTIGKSLEAEVEIKLPLAGETAMFKLMGRYAGALAELFNVSHVTLTSLETEDENKGMQLTVRRSDAPEVRALLAVREGGRRRGTLPNRLPALRGCVAGDRLCSVQRGCRSAARSALVSVTPLPVAPVRRRDARPYLLLVSALVILLDRLSKLWIDRHVPRGQFIPVIPHVFRISHVFNTGAAFSLFAESLSPTVVRNVLIAFSIVAVIVVLGMIWRVGRRLSLTGVALALILGGAIGNLYDRVAYHYVVDFLEVTIVHYHWPDFNVADSCIVVGACLLLLEIFRTQPAE